MADADRCACCGEIIPEGRQVCDSCLDAIGRYLQEERNAPWPSKREAMVIGIRYRCRRCGEELRWLTDLFCPHCGQSQNWKGEC